MSGSLFASLAIRYQVQFSDTPMHNFYTASHKLKLFIVDFCYFYMLDLQYGTRIYLCHIISLFFTPHFALPLVCPQPSTLPVSPPSQHNISNQTHFLSNSTNGSIQMCAWSQRYYYICINNTQPLHPAHSQIFLTTPLISLFIITQVSKACPLRKLRHKVMRLQGMSAVDPLEVHCKQEF
jgi:hypothetical protein